MAFLDGSKFMIVFSRCRYAIDLLVSPCRNHDDLHCNIRISELVNNSDAKIAKLDLQKICEVEVSLVTKRFSITAALTWQRILRHFVDSLENLHLCSMIKLLQIIFCFRKVFDDPAHSITTSFAFAISASVILSSRMSCSRDKVVASMLFAKRLLASKSS